jgi:hypothetical protein
MIKHKIFPTHNKLSFTGVKIKSIYAKAINDAMYSATELEGAYTFDSRGLVTVFTIYPQDFDFGDDAIEFQRHLDIYKECYEYTITNYPECIV